MAGPVGVRAPQRPRVQLQHVPVVRRQRRGQDRGATPFKRPENGQFLPGSNFDSFVFDETGDTDTRSSNVPELAQRGAWGSLFRVDFPFGNAVGTIRLVATGDADHASFDNITFATDSIMLVTEDRGDMLHDQLNKLDSVWAYDLEGHANGSSRSAATFSRRPTAPRTTSRPVLTCPMGQPQSRAFSAPTRWRRKRFTRSRIKPGPARCPAGLDRSRWFVTNQHGFDQLFGIFQLK